MTVTMLLDLLIMCYSTATLLLDLLADLSVSPFLQRTSIIHDLLEDVVQGDTIGMLWVMIYTAHTD